MELQEVVAFLLMGIAELWLGSIHIRTAHHKLKSHRELPPVARTMDADHTQRD